MTGPVSNETLRWRKSTFSNEINCVEMAEMPSDLIGVRNSKQPAKVVTFSPAEIHAFLRGVKAGEYDHLVE